MTAEKRAAEQTGADGKVKRVQTSLMAHFAKIKAGSTVLESSPIKGAGSTGPQPNSESQSMKSDPSLAMESTASSLLSQPTPPTFTEEDAELLVLELSQLPPDWLQFLGDELTKPYFRRLKAFLSSERSKGCKIFPPESAIYTWARLCSFSSIKVVIIGQDPYHNDNQAMGLCFSVPKRERIPPSLLNIYKELASDIPGFRPPSHGDLSNWAQQGVLLLNTSLTVRAHEPASHAGQGWEAFTDAVIRTINAHKRNVVFILWGNHAQKKAHMIDRGRHLVLSGVHPSPLSANRGFFGCHHFSKANEYLKEHGIDPVDWQLPQ
jgi:uracil-DNA glycosylase